MMSLFCVCTAPAAEAPVKAQVSTVGDGYSKTSVNTTVFRANSLATHGNTQYVAYYDPEGYMVVGKRDLDSDVWTTRRTDYRGRVEDAHNVISIGVDGSGRLHASFDHHGDSLHYARAIEPGSLELGPLESMTGLDEAKVTYPEFYTLPDGDLLFVYRSGASGRGNMAMNRYNTATGTWSRVQDVLLDGEDARSAYWQMTVDAQGVLHLSWVWRETWLVETNHDLCYARSCDGGRTWQKSTGETYSLPITAANAEYACRIPQNSELINQTSMTADAESNPYIATYWRDADSAVPQYRVVWNKDGKWQQKQVSNRTEPFSLSGGGTKMIPIARPRVVSEGDFTALVFRDAERGSKVSVAYTTTGASGEWTTVDLTDYSVDAWEPSVDTGLWNSRRILDIFVQPTFQGDGERVVESASTPVRVLRLSRQDFR